MSWVEVSRRKEKRHLVFVRYIYFLQMLYIFILFSRCVTFLLCTSFWVTHCLLFHSRSTKEKLVSHSGYSCLMKYRFMYFSSCHTRSLLRLHKCVTISTGLQLMKASVSRQITIWNEWAVIGKKMSVYLHVCFAVFPLSKGNSLKNALHFPGHYYVA